MGLLDDAIREHLDLKRRRGADPEEVERAEREALGPVRRNPSSADLEPAEDQAAPEGGFAYDQAEEDDWSHDSLQDPPAGATQPGYEEPPPAEPVFEQPPPAGPGYDEPTPAPVEPPPAFPAAADPAPEPHPAVPQPARPPTDLGNGETEEYDVEEFLAVEEQREPASDDDVLEETPEFLQDTPDHDRLWFEQRPPKDFDFDE
jgi:hypothetical protein